MDIKDKIKNNKIIYTLFKPLYRFYIDFIILRFIGIIFRIFPIKKNKIVVCSYYGNGYGDNPKYIIDELKKNKKLDIVWALNKNNYLSELPENVRRVKYETLKYLYELCTAKIWIDNCRKSYVPPKRKKQYYIQTWHGSFAIKKIELDARESLPKLYIKRAMIDSKNANLFTSGSAWTDEIYRRAFNYHGKILDCGDPRNDILFARNKHKNIRNSVIKKINIKEKGIIILYAPTFRKNQSTECYDIDFERLLKAIEKKYNKDCYILIRLHPNIASKDKNFKYNKNIINVTKYPDIQELMIAADILITDYSSSMFEFGITKKPCFLYTKDIEEYKQDRDLYFDFKKLPFPLATKDDELIKNINLFDSQKYLEELEKFYNKIGAFKAGNASVQVAKIILKECELDEKK